MIVPNGKVRDPRLQEPRLLALGVQQKNIMFRYRRVECRNCPSVAALRPSESRRLQDPGLFGATLEQTKKDFNLISATEATT